MPDILIISNVLLWIAVLAMGAIIFALVRQIGILYERVAPAGALMTGHAPRAGEEAPVHIELDMSGTEIRLGGTHPQGKSTLLFFLSPTCPVCKILLPILRSISAAEGRWLEIVLASDGPRSEHEAFLQEYDTGDFPYVLSTSLGLAYRVGKLPHAVLIDAQGIISAFGLVNSREHIESLFEASETGVASIQDYMEKAASSVSNTEKPTTEIRKEVV